MQRSLLTQQMQASAATMHAHPTHSLCVFAIISVRPTSTHAGPRSSYSTAIGSDLLKDEVQHPGASERT